MNVQLAKSYPEIIAIDANHCMAHWGSIFICVWRHETTMEGARLSRDGLKALAARRPAGIALLNVVEPNAPAPSAEVRGALARILTEFGRELKCSAVVHEGSGFRAAAVRGVVTGLTMLARQPFPHKVFATVDEAGAWLADNLRKNSGWDLTAADLIDAVADLRIRIQRS